jgi:hypothetical protein
VIVRGKFSGRRHFSAEKTVRKIDARKKLIYVNSAVFSDGENSTAADDVERESAVSRVGSGGGGGGGGRNFLVMKRRNAFWKLEHRDSLTSTSTSAAVPAAAPSCPSAALLSADSVFHAVASPRIPSARKFSVQF